MEKTKTGLIGHYKFTIHPFKEDIQRTEVPEGSEAVVKHYFEYPSASEHRAGERATLVLKPAYRPSTDEDHLGPEETVLNLVPTYGLGRTVREHEESHIDGHLKILRARQLPPHSTDEEYEKHMAHTQTLLDTCSLYHTDQMLPPPESDRLPPPENPVFNECMRILNRPQR